VFLEWGSFALFGVLSLSVFRKFSAPSSGNSTAPACCLRGGKRPADIAPPLARFCSEGGRWAGGQSSAAHPSPHHPSMPAAPSVVVHTFLPEKIRLAYRKRSTVGERLDRVL